MGCDQQPNVWPKPHREQSGLMVFIAHHEGDQPCDTAEISLVLRYSAITLLEALQLAL